MLTHATQADASVVVVEAVPDTDEHARCAARPTAHMPRAERSAGPAAQGPVARCAGQSVVGAKVSTRYKKLVPRKKLVLSGKISTQYN